MISFTFTKYAKKRLDKLPTKVQDRIISKLKSLKSHPDIFSVLKSLHDFEPATHRLRIGEYRLILALIDNEKVMTFKVLDLGHRRSIYR